MTICILHSYFLKYQQILSTPKALWFFGDSTNSHFLSSSSEWTISSYVYLYFEGYVALITVGGVFCSNWCCYCAFKCISSGTSSTINCNYNVISGPLGIIINKIVSDCADFLLKFMLIIIERRTGQRCMYSSITKRDFHHLDTKLQSRLLLWRIFTGYSTTLRVGFIPLEV